MKIARLKFPQISRFFSATVLWLSLAGLLLINFSLKAAVDPGRTNKIVNLLLRPTAAGHIGLAKALRQEERTVAAANELLVAVELIDRFGPPAVLGATTDPNALLVQWEQEEEQLSRQYRYWRQVAQSLPDYPASHLMAASLAYRLRDTSEAQRFALVTLGLDPNNKEAQQLLEALMK